MTFAAWLQQQMTERGWNNSEAAIALGVSHVTVGRWLKGRLPEASLAEKIAKALNADPDYVLSLLGVRAADPYFDPESPEAKLLPYIRAIDWDERSLGLVIAQLRQLVEFQGKEQGG